VDIIVSAVADEEEGSIGTMELLGDEHCQRAVTYSGGTLTLRIRVAVV